MTEQRILASSAVMAAGTVFSRASGFIRSALLVAGARRRRCAATSSPSPTRCPNMVYILLAGGDLQRRPRAAAGAPDQGRPRRRRRLRQPRHHPLGALPRRRHRAAGRARTRCCCASTSTAATSLPHSRAQLESIVDLTRWCLPQVFFYGMYVLVGQVLNARGRFGPMMWAPIANNLLAVAMLVAYLVVWGPVGKRRGPSRGALHRPGGAARVWAPRSASSPSAWSCVPYLRASGFTYRPRFDFRDPELKKTLSLGIWTVLFVIVTQAAYFVVVRLASGGAADGGTAPATPSTPAACSS